METSDAFAGLECLDCGDRFDAAETTHRCPECEGYLDPAYDYDAVDLDRSTLADRPFESQWRYRELLPFALSAAVTADEGATPLVECPALAKELGVDRLLIKDDSRNPTGALADRGQSVALTAAREHGAEDVALPTTGDGGQSAAAYAARAGLDSHVFAPSRTPFTNKAMINVHSGDMTIVGGRVDDAIGAYEDAVADEDWYSLSWFETPYRREGVKTALYELVEQLEWQVPDAVVAPTGTGVATAGLHKGATELRELGLIENCPSLYAAQAAGCAPIVDAWEAGEDDHDPIEYPDTICGGIEIPDPPGSPLVLDALAETGGGAVANQDPDILDSAVSVAANEGLEVTPSAAAAVSGAWSLSRDGAFDETDTVVVLNTGAGSKNDDVLRSHLMGQGV
jgi:threonine synthase